MASLSGFNAAEVDPTDSFTPVPAGDYPVVIVESEMKDTRDGKGQYLQLVLEVIDGNMKGRKLWDRLNLVNANSTAVEIAQKTLSQICHAVKLLQPQDSAELHGKPMKATVIVKDDPGYGPRNEVKGYKPVGGTDAPAPAAAEAIPAATMPPPSAAAGPQVSASPWAR